MSAPGGVTVAAGPDSRLADVAEGTVAKGATLEVDRLGTLAAAAELLGGRAFGPLCSNTAFIHYIDNWQSRGHK